MKAKNVIKLKTQFLKRVIGFILRLLETFIIVIAVLLTIFVISIDKMMPRQLMIEVPILAVLGIVLIAVLIKWRKNISSVFKFYEEKVVIWIRNHKIITFITLGIIIICLFMIRPIINLMDQRVLNDSLEHFSIISTQTVSEKRVNLTLIELEKALREIGSHAKVSITDPIDVYLYSDIGEFQEATGSSKSVCGLTRWTEKGPEIYIIAELPPDEKPILNQETPTHELAHAIELLITNNPRSLPLWIREGMANQYLDFWERVITHIGVWLERDKILSYDRLTIFRYNYPEDELEKQFFYSTSYEFVRYLYMHYGESTFWEIIHEVTIGVSYENAIWSITGRNESELYQDWLEGWP